MSTPTITVSNVIALWQLVAIIRDNGILTVKDATGIALASGIVGGGLPVNEGLRLGQLCKFLEIDNQNLVHTQSCIDSLLPHCVDLEPNIVVIRKILAKYISLENQQWLLHYDEDPAVFRAAVPEPWIEILDHADLFNFGDADVSGWWRNVFSRYQTYQEGKKVEQGKLAEKLTYDWEQERLEVDGFDNKNHFVKWASLLSDRFGFDIVSIRSKLLQQGASLKDKIQIEVKSAAASTEEEFRFFVSKPEWLMALENLNAYFFYCWVSTNLQTQTAKGPFIIPASSIQSHVPNDTSQLCEWSECRFVIKLDEFEIASV
jgi:hypothetical protein